MLSSGFQFWLLSAVCACYVMAKDLYCGFVWKGILSMLTTEQIIMMAAGMIGGLALFLFEKSYF